MSKDDKSIIKVEIDLLQRELSKIISESNVNLTSTEIIRLSQELDDLIVKYIGMVNE